MDSRCALITALTALSCASLGCDGGGRRADGGISADSMPAGDAAFDAVSDARVDTSTGPTDVGPGDAAPEDSAPGDSGGATCETTADCADPVHESCDASSGACAPSDLGSDTRVTYDDGLERRYVGCLFCDATLQPDGSALLRYQQGDGLSIWTLNLPRDVATGVISLAAYPEYIDTALHAHISENGAEVPAALRGFYDQSGGTLTLSRVELRSGGTVEGTMDAPIEVRGATPAKTGRLRATFTARFP